MSLTRAELAERAERKAQDKAAKERILRRLRWRPTTLDELAAALTTSQAPAAILTCREVTARRLRDLADDGLIVPDGAAWRLKGDARTHAEPPPPSPSLPSTRVGEVSAPPLTDPEPAMQGQTPDHRLPADVTLDLVRQALAALEPATIHQLTDHLSEGRREGEVVYASVAYAVQKMLKSGEAEKAGGQGTKFSPRLYRMARRQPIAKAEPAPAHDVTCYDIEAEKAAREPSAVPSGEVVIVPPQMPPGLLAVPLGFLSLPVIQAALDAAGCPSGSDPLHRIEVLGDFAKEHREDAEAKGAVLDELCRVFNLDGYRGLPELARVLVAPCWVSSPLGDLCVDGARVLVSVGVHAPAGTRRQAEILDDSGKMLARVSLDPTWPEDRWKPLLLDIRAKLMDPERSEIPF